MITNIQHSKKSVFCSQVSRTNHSDSAKTAHSSSLRVVENHGDNYVHNILPLVESMRQDGVSHLTIDGFTKMVQTMVGIVQGSSDHISSLEDVLKYLVDTNAPIEHIKNKLLQFSIG